MFSWENSLAYICVCVCVCMLLRIGVASCVWGCIRMCRVDAGVKSFVEFGWVG